MDLITTEVKKEGPVRSSGRSRIKWLFYLVVGVLITFLALRPLIGQMESRYLGERPDETYTCLIIFDWLREAIFERHTGPIFCPDLAYPLGFNLGLSDGWLPVMLASPLVWWLGMPLGYNISLFIFFLVSFLACCLLMEEFGRDTRALAVGALVGTANVVTAGMLYRDNTLYTIFVVLVPLGMLLCVRLHRLSGPAKPSRMPGWPGGKGPLVTACALGLVLFLSFLTSVYHLYMLFFFIVLLSVRSLFPPGPRSWIFLRSVLVSGVILLAGIIIWISVFSAFPGGWELVRYAQYYGRSWRWTTVQEDRVSDSFKTFKMNFAFLVGAERGYGRDELPMQEIHQFADDSPGSGSPGSGSPGSDSAGNGSAQQAIPLSSLLKAGTRAGIRHYLGWSLLVMLCCALVEKRKKNRFWILAGLIFLMVSLGPRISLGKLVVPNPVSSAVRSFPGMNYLLVSAKFMLMTFFCWGVVAVDYLGRILNAVKPWKRFWGHVLAASMVLECLAVSLLPAAATFTVTPNGSTGTIMNDPHRGAVFEMVSSDSSRKERDSGTVDRIFHGKPVVGDLFVFHAPMMEFPPVFFSGVILEQCQTVASLEAEKQKLAGYRNEVRALWQGFEICFIRFHRDTYSRSRALTLTRLLRTLFGEAVYDDGKTVLFRTCVKTTPEDISETTPEYALISPAERADYLKPERMWPLVKESKSFEDCARRLLDALRGVTEPFEEEFQTP